MPIDRDEFLAASPGDLERGERDDRVLEYLAYDPSKAYTLSEINSSVDLPLLDLAARLTRLQRDGKVMHKGSYWAVSEDYLEAADEDDGDAAPWD